MNPFGTPKKHSDLLWDVAARTQIFIADEQTVSRLSGVPEHDDDSKIDGVLLAARHPTGWFVHAVRREGLTADQSRIFVEMVTVRCHALLSGGPESPTWLSVPGEDEWRSLAFTIEDGLDELEHVLV